MSLVIDLPVGATPVNLFTLRPGVRKLVISARDSLVDLYFATQASQQPLTTANGTLVSAGTNTTINLTPGVAGVYPFTVQAVTAGSAGLANSRSTPF